MIFNGRKDQRIISNMASDIKEVIWNKYRLIKYREEKKKLKDCE